MFGYDTIGTTTIGDSASLESTNPQPTGQVVLQPAPDGQSQRFVGTTTNATSGSYILDGSGATADIGPSSFPVTNNAFDFTVAGIPSGTYTPVLTAIGTGGSTTITGTSAFTIVGVSGGGEISDTEAPVLAGSVSITNITVNGFTASWQAATDNVGVVDYELDNGSGTFGSVGNVLTYPVTGKAASTAYPVRLRAKDAAGLYSNVITATATTSAPAPQLDTENPAIPGTLSITNITSDGCTVSYQAGTDNVGIVGYEVSADTGTPNYIVNGTNLSKVIAGLPDNTAHTVRVRAYDAAGNKSTALTATFTTLAAIDSTVPVWSNGTTVTSSAVTYNSFAVTWPAATDNVGVTGYELDNGSGTYVSVGNVLTINVTGKASATAFTVRVRAFDSAGNKSAPISKVVTTLAAPVTTNNVVVFARNSDAPVVQALSALSSVPIGLVYKINTKQDLVLFNKSGSAVVVTLRGSGATTATTKGLAGVAIDLSVGLPISVPAGQFVTLMLDNAVLFLKQDVTLTASANGAVFAGVVQ